MNFIYAIFIFLLGLFSKWIWDRLLSKKSRVSVEVCNLLQQQILQEAQNFTKTCVSELTVSITEIKNDIKDMKNRIEQGDEYFVKVNKFQTIFAMVLLQVCEKEKIDCSDIRKAMYEAGILK